MTNDKKRKWMIVGLTILSIAPILLPIAAPTSAFAASNTIKSNVFDPTILGGPLTICTGSVTANTGGTNLPVCQNLCDLVAQIANVIYFFIAVVIWIIAPVLITVGGVMIMLYGANPGMIETGKKTITGAIWGIVIVLCAWLIVFTFVSAMGNLGKYVGGFGGNGGQIECGI